MSKLVRCTLGDIGKVKMCKRVLKNQTSESGDIPFYKISTFGGEPSTFISRELFDTYKKEYSYPKKGDVLLSAAGTLGKKIVFNGEKAYFQDSNIVWLENDESKVLNKYLYYFYDVIKWKKTSGSTIDRLYNENILGAEIYYPDMATQKQIVNTLSLLDSKIENNNKIISTLESLAKTIYDYWFLQFEFPNEDGKPYKSSGGKMVWNEELKREIPEGWKCDNIASLISNEKGGDWGKESLTNNYSVNVYCIRGADFPASTGCKDMNAPERWILEKNKWKELEYGDILVEISGGSPTQSTGRVCYVNNNYLQRFNKPVITSNFCRALSLKTPDYYSWFYLMWKTLYENDLFFNYEGKTTGLKNLLFDTAVNEIKIPLPEKRILDKFVEKINPFYENIQFCCQQNKELASLRDFLLPMLMNGQVTFKEDE